MKTALEVRALVDRLGREELNLKNAGAFAEAAGIRDAIVQILRLADADEESIEPTEED
jgi:hypothetical protein